MHIDNVTSIYVSHDSFIAIYLFIFIFGVDEVFKAFQLHNNSPKTC